MDGDINGNTKEKDSRRSYLLRIASYILGLNITEEKLRQTQPLDSFCETATNLLVFARSEQKVELWNQMKPDMKGMNRVAFYKSQSIPLTPDNYKNIVNVVTMNGASPNEVFLKSVQNVFSKNITEQASPPKQLINVVNELEENLLATVEKGQGQGVSSLPDEIKYWKSVSGSTAQQYSDAFYPLQLIIDTLENRSIEELSSLVDAYEDTCDQLWNSQPPYPEGRMRGLLISMASYLSDQICTMIKEDEIWKDPKVEGQLRAAIAACEQWELAVKLLTGQTWRRQPDNEWKGEAVKLTMLEGFRKRLEEVLSLKLFAPQIGQLLSDKQAEKEVEKIVETTMKGTAALAYNPFTESNWRSRLMVAERAMEPLIERTIPVLKLRMQPNKRDFHNIPIDIERYRNFLCRAKIKEKLQAEREGLLTRVAEVVLAKESEINEKIAAENDGGGRFLSSIAASILFIRQQITLVESILYTTKGLLDDLPAYQKFQGHVTDLLEKCREMEREQFDNWCRETQQTIDDPADSIALETKGKIMILEQKKGTLNINYSDRLLKLLKEVRQLASLGLTIPAKIINVANNGEKFYRYGVTLKQIAHFYNTIDQQMLPCQQALMLDEAVAFEKLILPKKGNESTINKVTWEDPKQVEQFIQQLQEAEEKLANHNRRLRNVHSEIVQMVMDLINLDIIKDVTKWKAIITKMRSKIMEEEIVHGASKSNMKPWLIHWDRQLYKALQVQYQWGIESLQTQIPLISAQLVFMQQKLQLRPPIEEIRMKYYKEMTKFLRIPEKFKGMLDSEQTSRFFASMADRNGTRFPSIYEKAEQLVDRLCSVDEQFADWLVLAQVDLEDLIEEKFTKANDWETQFKLLKAKGREAEKIPTEIRIDCVVVNASGAKNAIEELLQRLYDTLTWTLKHSINTNLQTINQFLSQAISMLSTRPQSIDEVAEANGKHSEYAKMNKQLKGQWKVMEEQHTLLRAVAGSGLEQMNATGQEWERFEQMLDSHQEMIKEQVDVLKSNVGIRVRALNDDAAKLLAKWDQLKPKSDALQGDRETMLRAIEFIKEKRLQLNELLEQKKKLDKDCEQFDVPTQQLETLDKLAADIAQYEANWVVYEEFNTELQKLADEEWIVFRGKTYLFDEFLQQWVDKLKAGNQTHMGLRLMKDIESFKELSSCLKYCRGEVLSADHWLEMFRLLQLPKGTTIEKLKFGDLLLVGHNITANVDQLKALNARAQGEVTIREAILELEMWAAQSSFALIDYKHSNGQTMKVIKDWKESINSVKDSQALLQSLKSSPFYTQFQDKTGIWETRLADLDVYLAQMNEIQRKWIYLEPIFGRGALPSEASRFARVDSEFRAILADVAKDPRLVSLCSRQSLKRSLEQIVDQLNRCQRALNQFLEEKRSAFPRFYFLGDDDLLEILGQSTNPTVIQSHLKKLFQGINRVVFGANNETITTIVSAQGENVSLSRPVRILPQVEVWLQQLTDEMRNTLKLLTVEVVRDANPSPSKYPSQVLCLAEEIRFCSDCEQTLNGSRDLHGLKKQLQEQLKTFTNTKVEDAVLQLKLKALILDLIHHIDVVEQLITNKASSTTCWTWQRQLRFYLDKDSVVIRQVNSQFDYTYEYQGNAAKLVHTPLTDKCYLTLTQAMYMGLGGNPYGPAGTGKTESVKALASLFGRQVLVFNCDEALDVHSMSRIFVGIVQCGAWGCFDEFNRLESRVLSAISMQIQTIQNAIKNKSSTCTLGSKTASVNPNSAIFITLNPAGKGYGGRQKMPDNLKQLFRPVVMSVPDNELIAETLLYSEGFTDAAKLARKVVTVFVLSKEMLSNQQHYDWGLRALKTVLKGCGDLRAKNEEGKNEADIVVQALLLNTLSKLTFADSKRFNVLVDDIFSAPNKEMTNFGDLIEPLANAAKEMNIELTDKQLQKVFQLYEQLRQRMGVVIVGPPGSGKSTIWKVLHRALVLSGAAVRKIAFNPKAINRTKLLGNMDVDTREWQDGIITMAAREVIKDTSVHRWIVCDGDIDPEWIEALNSVLDDNRLLTMPSGERIQFGTNVNFLFETDSLQHASPATVSRMGMIFISEEDLTSKEIINHWLKQCTDSDNQDLPNWIEEYFYRALTWTESKTSLPGLTRLAIVENGLSHLRNSKTKLHFQMNLYRGLAPLVDAEKRKDLAGVVFQNTPIPDQDHPDNVYWDQRMDSLMCFTDDAGIRVKREDVEKDHTRPLILTAQAQAARDYMTSWLEPNNRHSFLVIGPNGCGKEKLLSSCFEADSQSQVATIHCSAQSRHELIVLLVKRSERSFAEKYREKPKYAASTILLTLLQNCVQASNANGRVLRPKDKPNLILYMKSLNLPSPDKYGTNEMLGLLQQLLTYEGYYDEHLEWIGIENIQFIGSMSVQSSSTRSALPPRLFSPIRIFSVNNPSESNLNLIYSSYLTPILEPVLKSSGRVETIALSIVQLFEDLKKSFKASDHIHYDFSPRDVTKLVTSMLRYDLQEEGNIDSALIFEAERTFRDRLVNEEDRQRFDEIISNAMPHARSKNRDSIYASSGTILQGQHSVGLPMALQLRKDYTAGLQKAVNRFEFEVANISSVLTTEMCDLCMKVDRGLTCPGGSLLLAGRSGMGRRDAVRLVANLHQLPVFSPPITANFSAKQFHNELKNAIQTSISNGEHSVFLLEDYQLLDRSFLLSINSLLASGDVPGLFTTQEMDGMTAALRDSASQDAFQGHLLQYFAHRVKSLVHVVLIADIDGDEFDIRMAENPSIFKSSTVIWLDTWNRDSLIQMPKLMLAKSNVETSDDLAQACCDIQLTVPVDLAKPIKYKKFIENYAKIYTTKRTAIASRLERLQAGVAKLTEAREEVAKLQKAAAKKSKLLAAKQAEADEALKAITQSMTGAEDQKVSMEQLRAETEKENERIEAQKKIIDEQLKDVEPMLKEAREAVGSIKSESLSEIRSLRAPPEAIRDILQAVLLFMGILDTSWEAMRKFLSKSGVKEEIINFDAHRISRDVHKKVSALVQSKAASFDPKNARRASVAAQPLAAWVTANLQYSTILEKISPLENEKNQLLKNLSKAEKQIEKLSKGLQTVDEKVADLKATFEVLMKEATQIKIDLDREEATIKVAATLVEKLAGEFERWQQQMGQLSEELRYVERGSLLCAAFVTYLGGVSERQRKDVIKQLKQILRQSDFDPIGFIASQTEQLNWKNDGLPADELSVQNGVVLFNDSSTPLVIDPTGRVPAFLQKHVDKAELLKAAQNDLITQIEFGLRFGKTIIVDDVIEVDPTLVPILRKDLTSIGPRQMISFAGKQIEFNPEFRMFLCTRNEQIRMPICTRALLSEVNFTTTKSGLSSQLLGLAIQLEKPELEERSSALARDSESKKLELEKLEQLLLQQLASSEGNLLENTSLLDSLNKSKENAETIEKSIQESEQLRAQLAEQRNAYLSLAEFASSLYFAFSDLHRYNHMYNYNVNLIISLFTNTVQNCTDSTSTRIDTLCRTLQLKVFYTISRSLFKADRLTFALNFIHETMPKMFAKNEWELLTGIMVDENTDTSATMRSISWVEDSRATAIAKLQSHLSSLYNTLQLNDLGTWTEFSKSVECENAIPNSIVNKITPFQTVLLIQAVRPDRLYAAMQQFVLKILSISSVNPPPFSLADVFDESSSAQPILLLLAGGADPSQELVELAASKGHRLESISMGQGQETAAAEAIRRATAEGFWLCLGNVHLMLSIVPVIQKELALAQIHKDFRLWLTAEADNHFSPIMLQQCMKVTFEPPPGIKNNMLRTYGQIEEAKRTALTCQSIFVLAWMHALLQERRTYIPQAWTKFYEFSNADVRVARVLIEQLTGQGDTDWEFIRGLLQFVIYGGRIESQFDSNVLVSYLNTLFNGQKITGQRGQQVASGIEIITADNIKEFVNHTAKSIPDEDEPALFGLPANIRFSWQLTEAEETVARMRNAAGSKSAIDRKQLADAANPLLQLWKKLCQGSDLHNRALPTPKESTDPIVEVLSLEWVHAVQIVQSIHGSLSSISRCIRGASIPDRVTLQSMESLLLHQCPDEWSNYWTGPRESAEYLNAVIFKAKSTQEILSASEKGDFLQNPVNLSMLFRPTTLLNALRQATARKMSKALDELRLVSSWDNRPQAGAVLSMQVKGIQLQGALFDGLLRETSSSSPPTTVAPPLALSWMPLDSSPASSSDSVLVPLYSDSDRQSLIAPVTMPCRNPDQWNIAAVALFLK